MDGDHASSDPARDDDAPPAPLRIRYGNAWRARGATFLEMLIVLAAFLGLVAVIAAVRSPAAVADRDATMREQMHWVTQAVRQAFAVRDNYSGLATAVVGDNLRNPYGGTYTVAPLTYAGTANGAFGVTASALPQAACVTLWTHNLTAWFTGAAAAQPTRARATVMIGFPELGDNCPNPPCAGQAVKYEDCVVVQATCAGNYADPYCPNGSVVTPSCPAGKVEAGSYPHCGHHQTVFTSTDVGSVTLGSLEQYSVPSKDDSYPYTCNAACNEPECNPQPPSTLPRPMNHHTFGYVSLNNTTIASYLCKVDFTRTRLGYPCGSTPLETSTTEWPRTAQYSGRDKICCTVRN